MARPKGKLFALLAVFAAIGLITASGAFTTVSAERTVSVQVQGDDSAVLRLAPYDGPNGNGDDGDNSPPTDTSGDNTDGGYAYYQNGMLELSLQDVNLDAYTTAENVFTIHNDGNAPVAIWIEKKDDDGPGDEIGDSGAIAFAVTETQQVNGDTYELKRYGNQGNLQTDVASSMTPTNAYRIDDEAKRVVIDVGETLVVSVYIDTSDSDPENGLDTSATGVAEGEDLLEDIVVHAAANYDEEGTMPKYEIVEDN